MESVSFKYYQPKSNAAVIYMAVGKMLVVLIPMALTIIWQALSDQPQWWWMFAGLAAGVVLLLMTAETFLKLAGIPHVFYMNDNEIHITANDKTAIHDIASLKRLRVYRVPVKGLDVKHIEFTDADGNKTDISVNWIAPDALQQFMQAFKAIENMKR
ncbi:MAG: hypothetical protein Fur0041_15640 [Bacteroidia bacterium]